MRKKASIPVNTMTENNGEGISIDTISLKDLPAPQGMEQSERHDRHTFHVLEKGTINIEIDFQKYTIQSPALVYMHPRQVHRLINFRDVTVSTLAINDECLNPEYLALLEGIAPANPLVLECGVYAIISEAVSLCIKFAAREKDKLYHPLLKDSCNALAALFIAQFLGQSVQTDQASRFATVTKSFNQLLERKYTTAKRPAEYAKALNISVAYLNECIKNATGHPVSYHIQHRIVLEAKRLLHHSAKSVKEIATELGYDDHPYFSRLFTKVTGMSALAFRNKNHD